MGNIWGARAIPICSPYVPHMFDIWGKFQKQPNHMWPICCLTYGETYGLRNNIIMGKCGHFCIQISSSEHMGNIWETYGEHMGNIWGNIWGTYGKHMGNIWETYGEHMGNIWETYGEHTQSNTQQNLSLPLLMQHPQGQSGFHKVCFESLFIINKDGRMNSGSTARADEILTWQQASVFAFSIHLML